MNIFKIHTPGDYSKQTIYGSGNRPCNLKIQKISENNIIKVLETVLNYKKKWIK